MAASSSLSFCLVSWRSKATDEKTERDRIWLVPSSRFKLHSFLLLFPIILFIVARVLLLLQRTHKSKTTTRRRPSRRLWRNKPSIVRRERKNEGKSPVNARLHHLILSLTPITTSKLTNNKQTRTKHTHTNDQLLLFLSHHHKFDELGMSFHFVTFLSFFL